MKSNSKGVPYNKTKGKVILGNLLLYCEYCSEFWHNEHKCCKSCGNENLPSDNEICAECGFYRNWKYKEII